MSYGRCQRQQARTAADRRCGRPREVDRPADRHRGDGRTRSQKAARSRYGSETDVHAEINTKTGELRLPAISRSSTSSRTAPRDHCSTRKRANPGRPGRRRHRRPLPPMDFGRIAAQSAKQVIVQKVREAERDRQYDEYKDRIGEIVNGASSASNTAM
jgi:hypothetical protein